MTFETAAYALLALALAFGLGALLFFFVMQRASSASERSRGRLIIGDPEKQLAMSVVLAGVLFTIGLAYVLREPTRMAQAEQRQTGQAIEKGAHTFLSLCVSCHGTQGEGGIGKALNTRQFHPGSAQEMDRMADTLRKTISRGRYGTAMPAWAQDDGGPLNQEQINQLVTLIQYGGWDQVARLAASAPAQPAPARGTTGARVPDTAQAEVLDLSGQGKQLFAAKGCAACHGAELQGAVGPSLRQLAGKQNIAGMAQMNADNLKRWLANPVAMKPGTAMPSLGLSAREIEALAAFLMEQK